MFKTKGSTPAVCDRCAEQLEYVACRACGGKGYFRVWIFFKRECGVCSGSGSVLRCPNEYQHIVEDFKLSRRPSVSSLYKNFRNVPLPKTQSGSKKPLTITNPPPRLQIPPPWHPSYPNPWHPMHPRNPRNQPFSPMNPNSPTNPNNPMNPMNPINRMRRK